MRGSWGGGGFFCSGGGGDGFCLFVCFLSTTTTIEDLKMTEAKSASYTGWYSLIHNTTWIFPNKFAKKQLSCLALEIKNHLI